MSSNSDDIKWRYKRIKELYDEDERHLSNALNGEMKNAYMSILKYEKEQLGLIGEKLNDII